MARKGTKKRLALHKEDPSSNGTVAGRVTKMPKFKPRPQVSPGSRPGKPYTFPGVFQNKTPTMRVDLPRYPGDEGEDGSALSPVDSVADSDESDQAQAAQERERLLNSARAAALNHEKTVVPVPQDVAKISQGVCWIFRRAWDVEGWPEDALAYIEKANTQIQDLNKHASRGEHDFTIPGVDILQHIELFKEYIVRWDSLYKARYRKRNERKKAAKTVVCLLHNLLPKLAQCGLSYKSVTTAEVVELITTIVEDAELRPETKKKLNRYLQQDFELPSSYQASIVGEAHGPIRELFSKAGQGKIEEAGRLVPMIEEFNQELAKENEVMGFKPDDHQLPTQYLHRMLKDNVLSSEQCAQAAMVMQAQFALMVATLGYTTLAGRLSSDEQMKMADLPQDVIQSMALDVRGFQKPLEAQPKGAISFFDRIREISLSPASESFPDEGYRTDDPSDTSTLASADANPHPNGVLKKDGVIVGIRPPRVTADGKTDLGQVVHVQRIGLSGFRILLNKGSSKYPVYRLVPGSEFPPDKMKELSRNFILEKHKHRSSDEIEMVTDIAELDTGNVTRFRVVWRTAPKVTFPTRSELISIVGKLRVDGPDGLRRVLREKRDQLIDWHETCRTHDLHPDHRPPNKKRISAQEKISFPWIFDTSVDFKDQETDGDHRKNEEKQTKIGRSLFSRKKKFKKFR